MASIAIAVVGLRAGCCMPKTKLIVLCIDVHNLQVWCGCAGNLQQPRPSWVAEEAAGAWDALTTHCAPLLADCNLAEAQLWGPWANSPAPEASLPSGPAGKLSAFQRLLLIQVCTSEQLY